MTKRFRWRVLVLVMGFSMIAVVSSSPAGEEGPRKQPGTSDPMAEMMRGMGMGRMSDLLGREHPLLSLALRHRQELGLSADQVKTLEELIQRFGKDAEARVSRIETAEQDLAALFKADSVDLGKVESKVREIETLRADLRIARIKTIVEGRAALTPEQRKKLEGMAAAGPGRVAEGTRGMEEMERFMNSERMPQAMAAMMEMARRMGDGDTMLGMVRMMEMMGSMGGMMGGGGGTMGEQPHHDMPREQK